MSKKIILASLVAGMAASSALAVEKAPTVTLGGSLDTQIGYRNEKGLFKYIQNNPANLVTTNGKRHTTALVNDTRVNVGIDGKAHGMSYGGRIALNADTSANKFRNTDSDKIGYATMAYAESYFGRVEAGNTTSVYDAMSVSAADVARASGGASAGDAQYWVNPINLDTTGAGFIAQEGLFSNLQTGGSDHAAKVNYFTPTYGGLKLAVSFTPDMEQKGTAATTHSVTSQLVSKPGNTITNAFKNVVTGAATYEGKSNNVGVKVGVSGERGSAKRDATTNVYRKLSSAQAGLQFTYSGFNVAGSYANLGKSGQAKNTSMKASSYWTAGLGFDHNKFGASVTYFASQKAANYTSAGNTYRKFNKSTNWSVGADYKLAPGFLPYVEYTNFDYKYANPSLARNRGNVVLAGTKLQF